MFNILTNGLWNKYGDYHISSEEMAWPLPKDNAKETENLDLNWYHHSDSFSLLRNYYV